MTLGVSYIAFPRAVVGFAAFDANEVRRIVANGTLRKVRIRLVPILVSFYSDLLPTFHSCYSLTLLLCLEVDIWPASLIILS